MALVASSSVPGAEGYVLTDMVTGTFTDGYDSTIFVYATPNATDSIKYKIIDSAGFFMVPYHDSNQWYFDGWETFLNTITFGLLYKDEVTVKVNATDTLSGIERVEYAVADKAMTLEQVKAIDDWEQYRDEIAVTVEDTKRFVYFVRITDNASNVNYLSTDGAEYDVTAPLINGVENGKNYYTTQKVKVTDKNRITVTLNGEPVTDRFTLEGNKEASYTIAATDSAGNTSTVTVTMKPVSAISANIDSITVDTVKSTDKDNIQKVIDEVDELLSYENLTQDEKDALEEINDKAEKLVEKIEKVAGAIDTEYTSPNTADNSNISLWLTLLFVSGSIILSITIGERKRKAASKN